MLSKKIKYTTFDGVEMEETFYFNLTEAEIAELELSMNGGLSAHIQAIVEAKDQSQLIKLFKRLILMAYGEKSNDGKYFRKSEAIREDFASTEAYSVLFMELATDADAATKFVNGIIPAKAQAEVAKRGTHPALTNH